MNARVGDNRPRSPGIGHDDGGYAPRERYLAVVAVRSGSQLANSP